MNGLLRNESRPATAWFFPVLVLAGSVLRACFGLHLKLWNQSPDQLAWGWVIEDLSKNGLEGWHQLLHYPHEGGSAIMSLLALCFTSVDGLLPPLSWAALFADTISRYIQLRIAYRLWGWNTAIFFGAVSIVSGFPLMLPWATLNFGMHAAASVMPFIMCYILVNRLSPILTGVFTGLAISFSYDSLVFVPVCLIVLAMTKREEGLLLRSTFQYLIATTCALIPHLAVRAFGNTGFEIDGFNFVSIRGAEQDFSFGMNFFSNLIATWRHAFPSGFFLNSVPEINNAMLRFCVLVVILAGFILCAASNISRMKTLPGLLIILSFTIMFAASPFFSDEIGQKSHVYYRYFAFIAPLCCALVFAGFGTLKRTGVLLSGLVTVACLVLTLGYVKNTKSRSNVLVLNAGWSLGNKYGHDPLFLMRVVNQVPDSLERDVIRGVGWGITSVLLERRTATDKPAVDSLVTIFKRFPASCQPLLWEGFEVAYAPGITPVLDQGLKTAILQSASKRN